MSSRAANEKRFKQWTDTSSGRIYQRKVNGQRGWYALYIKEVDINENIISFRQEIYDDANQLIEIHQKYPEDTGHQKV